MKTSGTVWRLAYVALDSITLREHLCHDECIQPTPPTVESEQQFLNTMNSNGRYSIIPSTFTATDTGKRVL